jgi:hypothetical protein
MATTIWKYYVPDHADYSTQQMPRGALLLHTAIQDNSLCLWALVDPAQETEAREFVLAGTGHAIDCPAEQLAHVGTYLMHDGALVLHLLEIVKPEAV